METKFTKAMDYFNTIINQVEKGSKEIGANDSVICADFRSRNR